MNIFGIIMAIGYSFLNTTQSLFIKKIDIDPVTQNLIFSVILFIFYYIYVKITYKFNPDLYKIKKNKFNISSNPFKNIFTNINSWYIGFSITILFLLLIISIKNLPLGIVIPTQMIWLFFALILSKFIRKSTITPKKIISILLVIFGVIIININNIVNLKDSKSNLTTTLFYLVLLLIAMLSRAFMVTKVKQIEEDITSYDMMLMEGGTTMILAIVIYIIYFLFQGKLWTFRFPKIVDLGILSLVIILLTYPNQFLRFESMKLIPENLWTLLSTLGIILSLVYGKIFFGENINSIKILGVIILILGITYSKFYSFISSKVRHQSLKTLSSI